VDRDVAENDVDELRNVSTDQSGLERERRLPPVARFRLDRPHPCHHIALDAIGIGPCRQLYRLLECDVTSAVRRGVRGFGGKSVRDLEAFIHGKGT
jgi:hypothetical protein